MKAAAPASLMPITQLQSGLIHYSHAGESHFATNTTPRIALDAPRAPVHTFFGLLGLGRHASGARAPATYHSHAILLHIVITHIIL